MKLRPIKTLRGWEIAYDGMLEHESISSVYASKTVCVTAIAQVESDQAQIRGDERQYQILYAHACGYQD